MNSGYVPYLLSSKFLIRVSVLKGLSWGAHFLLYLEYFPFKIIFIPLTISQHIILWRKAEQLYFLSTFIWDVVWNTEMIISSHLCLYTRRVSSRTWLNRLRGLIFSLYFWWSFRFFGIEVLASHVWHCSFSIRSWHPLESQLGKLFLIN